MLHAKLLTHNALSHGFFTRAETPQLHEKSILTCKQIHSNIVHIVEAMPAQTLEGDALVTRTKGLAIGILTADCVPVLMADVEAGVIGAAHAGWRGALSGIVESTARAMESLGAKRARIVAAIGPCIKQASYEVGPEVFAKFMHDDAEHCIFFKPSPTPDHHWFDLTALVARRLKQSGIIRFDILPNNTYTEEEHFNSFRRSTHRKEQGYGNQCSAIMLVNT